MRCSSATCLQQRQRVGRRQLVDRQARQRQAGDVHFLDRPPRILQPIERRFGDELEPGGVQLFEQRAQRDLLARRELLRDRRARTPDTGTPFAAATTSRTRASAAARRRGHADDADLAGAGRPRHRRAGVGGDVGDAHERRRAPWRSRRTSSACMPRLMMSCVAARVDKLGVRNGHVMGGRGVSPRTTILWHRLPRQQPRAQARATLA